MPVADPSQRQFPEKRAYERVPVALVGRCMFENKLELPCQTLDISEGDVALVCAYIPRLEERVIVYLDNLGRLEGPVARLLDNGFAMRIDCTERKHEKLRSQIAWLKDHARFGVPNNRNHQRVEPRNKLSTVELPDGRSYPVEIIDISLSGAAVSCEVRPSLGTEITLGGMKGIVVRHFDEGMAIEFAIQQSMEQVERTFG